jgi:hypothetical protein
MQNQWAQRGTSSPIANATPQNVKAAKKAKAPLKMIVIHKRYEKRATIRSFFVSLQPHKY